MKIKELNSKSKVLITNRYYLLISYETIVLVYDKQNEFFFKLDKFLKKDFYNQTYYVSSSTTTTKHINSFLNYYNLKNNYEDKTKVRIVNSETMDSIDLLEIK